MIFNLGGDSSILSLDKWTIAWFDFSLCVDALEKMCGSFFSTILAYSMLYVLSYTHCLKFILIIVDLDIESLESIVIAISLI